MAAGSARPNRTRPSRVQITYDLEIEGQTRRKELPFVLGVLGDFAGKPDPPLPKLKDRAFVEVSTGTFNAVLRNMRPRLACRVANKLADDGSTLAVTLRFQGLEDFEPEQVARQVEALRQLIAVREQLSALRALVRKDGQFGDRLREFTSNAKTPRTAPPGAPSAGRQVR
jgi:type VI secretion system protein ImpB